MKKGKNYDIMNCTNLDASVYRKENRMRKSHKKCLSAAMSAIMTVSSAYVAEISAGVTAFANYGDDYMAKQPEFMQTLYNGLCEGIEEIAAGKRTSSVITVNLPTPVPYDNAVNILNEAYVLDAILYEYPYELFWFDFSEKSGGLLPITYYKTINGEDYLTKIVFKLPAAQAYMGEDKYSVNPEKVAAAAKAAENAKAIVEENKDKSDYEKLKAYKDKICELNTYNYEAINNPDTPYGDPWQLVYVFDNDPATNVVCEGYSKAFQYLCDITDFDDKTIRCASVTGQLTVAHNNNSTPSGHMWNIVTIGGKSYIVDVTNCDEKAIGQGDYLFMRGAETTNAKGCSLTIKRTGYETATASYSYDENTMALYDRTLLTVSTEDFLTEENPEKPEEVEMTGMCGDDIAWLLYKNEDGETYTLDIDGTGGMYSYKTSDIPWKDFNEKITDIIIGAKVTNIGAYLFINPFDTPVPANRRIKVIMTDTYSWIIDGSNITSLQDADIFSLTAAGIDTSKLRGTYGINFYTPDTNLPTSIEFNFEKEHAGKFANLYVQIDGVLCFMETAKIDENGTVVLPNVTALGNYAVMICEYSDLPGDVNNDGTVNVKDALAILKHAAGKEKGKNLEVADLNPDGIINVLDAILVLKKAAGRI